MTDYTTEINRQIDELAEVREADLQLLDENQELAWAIQDALTVIGSSTDPQGQTPSMMAKKVKTTTSKAALILRALDRQYFISGYGNGAWRRFTMRQGR